MTDNILPLESNSRSVAAEIIGRWLSAGIFPDRLIAPITRDRAFVMEVVYGVAKWKRMLEWVIRRCADGRPDKLSLPYLLVGMYQIFVMNDVADYAAVHETVAAAKMGSARHAAGFINWVLRRALRESETILEELKSKSLGIRESHPDVLLKKWERHFGKQETLALCKWNNSRPDITLRPNPRRISVKDFVAKLDAAAMRATPHPFAPLECVVLAGDKAGQTKRITELPGYAEGLFNVQDPSTLAAVALLNPRPGEFVLDACAAPGGKTALIAERMGLSAENKATDKGRIIAMDINADRLLTLTENLARMRVRGVEPAQGDAALADSIRQACGNRLFDRILIDAPCTNTGVLRRRADARWRFSEKRMNELIKLQRAMLDACAQFLKPGGTLVYSACSLESEECDAIVRTWLSRNVGFELMRAVKLFPPESKTDGIRAVALRGK